MCTFCVALERLGAQMCDAVTLEVLGSSKGFPTTLLRADKAAVVVMFPVSQTKDDDVDQ